MKAIYTYTLKKYLKSYSTWVILFLSAIGIGFIVGGYLPFAFVDVKKINAPINYVKSIVAAIAGVTVFFGIFSAIFAGFKSASMYKDEVENGTFLVLLSKPLKRGQIIFGKWLALQTILVGYGLISVFCLCVGIEIFDNGDKISGLQTIGVSTLKSHIWLVGLFIFLILYITSLFFSSIGLILSTRLSTGATIGITIALGIYIPLSGLLSIFMRKPEAIPVSRTEAYTQIFAEHFQKTIDSNPAMKLLFPGMKDNVEKLVETTKSSDIYNKAVSTDDKDAFEKAWWLDVDYQFRSLAGFAYEKIIPDKILNSLNDNTLGGILEIPKSVHAQSVANSKKLFDGISGFLEKYQSIGTDAAKALTMQSLLEFQPVTSNDFIRFVTSGKHSPIFKDSSAESTAIKELAPIAGTMTFDEVQQWLANNENLFVDIKKTLEEFMKFVFHEDASLRDTTNFIVQDNFKFKVPKPNLTNLRHKTKQNYDYLRKSDPSMQPVDDEYKNDKPYPQELFDNLRKLGDSEPLVNFLQHADQLYNDKNYDAYVDDSNTQLDNASRYIDFKLYKDLLSIEFMEDKPEGSTKRFYTTNLASSYIYETRMEQNGSIIFDEDFMRTSFYHQQHFWDYAWDAFKNASKGKGDPINNQSGASLSLEKSEKAVTATKYFNNIRELLEPVSNMLFQGANDGSLRLGDTEIQLRDMADLRKLIEGQDYDLAKRFNIAKYDQVIGDVEDPITNLSGKDKNLLRSILSASASDQLVNAKVQPYVNKTTLLIVYAVLALALVPVAHWLVRRQDFR